MTISTSTNITIHTINGKPAIQIAPGLWAPKED